MQPDYSFHFPINTSKRMLRELRKSHITPLTVSFLTVHYKQIKAMSNTTKKAAPKKAAKSWDTQNPEIRATHSRRISIPTGYYAFICGPGNNYPDGLTRLFEQVEKKAYEIGQRAGRTEQSTEILPLEEAAQKIGLSLAKYSPADRNKIVNHLLESMSGQLWGQLKVKRDEQAQAQLEVIEISDLVNEFKAVRAGTLKTD